MPNTDEICIDFLRMCQWSAQINYLFILDKDLFNFVFYKNERFFLSFALFFQKILIETQLFLKLNNQVRKQQMLENWYILYFININQFFLICIQHLLTLFHVQVASRLAIRMKDQTTVYCFNGKCLFIGRSEYKM